MSVNCHSSMSRYYDERASEYDEIYSHGRTGPSVQKATIYREEAREFELFLRKNVRGDVLDAPFGRDDKLSFVVC
jgi:hypothetical protein